MIKTMTTYETLNLLVTAGSTLGILAMMYHGIRVMARGADVRAADSERKHDEAMANHRESMTSLPELIAEQTEGRMAMRELIDGQAESRMALRELIERTR